MLTAITFLIKSRSQLIATITEYDSKKLLKAFKKEFACNGTLVDDEELGKVIQLQGDQRLKISNFLTDEGLPKVCNVLCTQTTQTMII
jgi:translation initiation factor SUI1